MIHRKTQEEIEIMRQGGKILAETLWEVIGALKPGVTELELDRLAEKLIVEKGGEPGFKKVKGYKHTICVSTNNVVVHGIPSDYTFQEGDVMGIDCGVYYKGFHTDMAETRRVSTVNDQSPRPLAGDPAMAGQLTIKKKDEVDRFLETGKRALEKAIAVARVGNKIGYISKTIQDIVERQGGYSIVRTLVGHGIGKNLHEEPEVPGFLWGRIEDTPKLVPGMTLAIEVIYNQGKKEVVLDADGWTISTKDRSLSGLFERTIAITESDPIVLTS